MSECTGHAEATREPTETSGVAETRGVEAAVLWTPLRAAHRTWNTGRPVFHKLPHPSLSRFCATGLDGHNPGKRTFLLWRKADISTLVRHISAPIGGRPAAVRRSWGSLSGQRRGLRLPAWLQDLFTPKPPSYRAGSAGPGRATPGGSRQRRSPSETHAPASSAPGGTP